MRAPLSSWVITVKVLELNKSLLDPWKFFRRFLNTLTAHQMYSLISTNKWIHTIHRHLSRKENIFSQFFCAFFKSALNLEDFQKKMTLIAYVFAPLPTTKDVQLQKSLLDTWKFFRPFLNTVTACDKYSLISGDKWMQTIQMNLSQKQNIFP